MNAQTDSKKENEYLLKGKLVSGFDKVTPLCGILAWATVVEFEIIEFSDFAYVKKRIPVIFRCPNRKMSRQFKRGKKYELILTDDNLTENEWTMLESNKDILTKYEMNKKYWFVEKKK